ncbi:prolyl oligopeptidase family serine peptidase [Flavobacterium oncorhynchi]|uniref:S9 family peptidase n=1 Tax=Flavobacterium oncorhynchi TaxID=728056 RepID=UPI00351A1393
MKFHYKKLEIYNSFAAKHYKRNYFLILTIILISFNGFSQSTLKKELTAKDYPLWSYLNIDKLSQNGKWVSFYLNYESGRDTLLVKNSIGTKSYSFPSARKGEFVKERFFLMMSAKEEMRILDLHSSKQEILQGVLRYEVCRDSQSVIILKKADTGKKQLELKNLENGKSVTIDDLDRYWYNPKADLLAYIAIKDGKMALNLLNLHDKTSKTISIAAEDFTYSYLVWQKNANSLAFFEHPLKDKEKSAISSVGYYLIKEGKLYRFNPQTQDNFPKDMQVISSSAASLSISENGKRIFFGLQKTMLPVDQTQTQIWNTQDKFLYTAKVQIEGWDRIAKVAVWQPLENNFNQITDNELPKMMLNTDQKYALLYNPQRYEPQANREAPLDIYMMNLDTGECKLVLENQSGAQTGTTVAIYEKQLIYFKDRNWWAYDIESEVHQNLTKDLGVYFSDEQTDWPEEAIPFGNPGWIKESKKLFLYDKYDIWSIGIDGSGAVRLTDGRKNKTTCRIIPQSQEQSKKMNYDGSSKGVFKPWDRLLIKTEALESTGYCYWDKKNGLQPLLDKKMCTGQLLSNSNNRSYLYKEENYDLPPRLILKENSNCKEKTIFQSNPQHFKYRWGYSKMISYVNSKGSTLNGVLFYPAGYQNSLKYPMIVHIYEKQSKELFKYVNPSQNNPTGFNISNFTSKGYFVFLPDIVYEVGDPGSSSADCVISAVKKIISSGSVDSNRIGIIGHSYGGFEVDYIISQSNLFRAAVAGAAITDFVSSYLWATWGGEKPNFWHYEFGQLRIGKSLYEDYDRYLKNSPVYHADKVNTPLLSWAGEQDAQVHNYQSIEFHLALRRLGKINTMLLYPGEDHTLMNCKYQKDLTERIEQWFGYYLKGSKKPDWF